MSALVLALLFYRNIIVILVGALLNVACLALLIKSYLGSPRSDEPNSLRPDKPKNIVDNPWTGVAEVAKEPAPKDTSTFGSFVSSSADHVGHRLGGIKFSNPFRKLGLLRRSMRFLAGILIFMYTIVLAFSLGSIMSIMFIITDLVLFYMIWISRK